MSKRPKPPKRSEPPPKADLTPPPCLNAKDWKGHCLHYPRGFWVREEDEGPYTLTCCDCGLEWESSTFNRQCGTHGPHRTGEPPVPRG